jgi:hypothetical protein
MSVPPSPPPQLGKSSMRLWDAVCIIICLIAVMVGVRYMVAGVVMHQVAPVVSGACLVLIGTIGVLNRLWYRPLFYLSDEIPFFTAFHRRPWLLIICLALEVMAFESYFIWPSGSGPYW